MRQKLVVGNWKMHGSLAVNAVLLEGIKAGMGDVSSAVGVCVPFPYLGQCRDLLGGSVAAWGAQDVSAELQGAFTGEVSAPMIAEFGCRYVIVGHSERRTLHRESDELVARKTVCALEAGLMPIVCVGETLEEREGGATEAVVGRQLEAVLAALSAGALGRIVVAYEPVWAIGTGKTASSEQAQAVHAFLRSRLAAVDAAAAAGVRILYGGSVKPGNAAELFAMSDIDGGLIGGASLKADEFLAICRA